MICVSYGYWGAIYLFASFGSRATCCNNIANSALQMPDKGPNQSVAIANRIIHPGPAI